MTRIDKLYERVLADPSRIISFREFTLLIEAFGFEHQRTKGSHQSFAHPACPKLLVIQPKRKEAKRYQVREFLALVGEYDLHMRG